MIVSMKYIARNVVSVAAGLAVMFADGAPVTATVSVPSTSPVPYATDEIVVGYVDGTSASERRLVRQAVPAVGYRSMPRLDVIELSPRVGVAQAVNLVAGLEQVAYAEPNYIVTASEAPNDPLYRDSWSVGPSNPSGYRSGIDTPSVWNLTVGGDVAVGVVDSGIDLTHPDLVQNLWKNAGESGGGFETNGLDDDGNGYVDDWQGWDWIESDNDPTDLNGHGTSVAGTIGAHGDNGIGGSGVSWTSRLVPLRVLNEEGIGFTSDTAAAFSYAAESGAKVVNASLTSEFPSLAIVNAIAAAPDTLFAVAAGNNGTNNETAAKYPCNVPLTNILCVASTNEFNKMSAFSNYGAVSVDLAAPGEAILTTHPDGYVEFYGTSAAAPHVAGVAALLWARRPDASTLSIRQAIVNGVEALPGLQGKTASGGRLNAAGAFRQMGDSVPYDDGGKRFTDRDQQNQTKQRCRRHKRHKHKRRARRCGRR
jgi:subtilisin family serine protease